MVGGRKPWRSSGAPFEDRAAGTEVFFLRGVVKRVAQVDKVEVDTRDLRAAQISARQTSALIRVIRGEMSLFGCPPRAERLLWVFRRSSPSWFRHSVIRVQSVFHPWLNPS
jgi:hypothetical protein